KSLIEEIGKKKLVVEKGAQKIIAQEDECRRIKKILYENYEEEWINSIGEKSFDNAVNKLKNYNTILTTSEEEYKSVDKKRLEQFKKVTDLRREYCVKNSLTWDTHVEENEKYIRHLKLLVETKLPEYIEKISIQKEKAYAAFKNDLLSRLKDAIDKTEEQVTFINRSLEKMNFGEKRYKFIVRPKKNYIAFYNMLKHDFLGMNLTLNLFEEKYKDQIEFLFNLIVNTTQNLNGNDMEQLRKQIDIYTDYKTYLEFDMEQKIGTDKSDLSKTLTKNSGGETQSPFFIAVIAAFANHYRIYNSKDNNTMRLIIFDEAFSKMDEEHAMISIQLLRKLGFQAIIAAPDDKIPVIGPNADKIIYAKNENKRRITIAEFEDKEIEKLINCEI
ncbi:MAG: SbcC/MukB-like Walker B domain-containing protein, partial [Clostridium sp.]|nr:SbcC/MukB-like Walker B domain-containing protein [Clostridium sp.]